MTMDAKSEYVIKSLSLTSAKMKRSMSRESIGKRIGAVSYHADKDKQLVFPFLLFQLRNSNNCIMRKSKNQEEWRDVPGYEGLYRVSNYGRIIAAPRKRVYVDKNGTEKVRYYERRYVEPKPDNHNYRYVRLCDRDDNTKSISIHRLVAMVFIPNPDNLPVVNHKDENPGNNRADNLEWCTNEYNIAYGTAPARHGKTLSENYRKKAIAEDEARMARLIERRGQITAYREKNNSWFGPFNSLKEARLALKITKFDRKLVENCLRNKVEKAHGYAWFYEKWRMAGKYGFAPIYG